MNVVNTNLKCLNIYILQDLCCRGEGGAAVAAGLFKGPPPVTGVPAARGSSAGESGLVHRLQPEESPPGGQGRECRFNT